MLSPRPIKQFVEKTEHSMDWLVPRAHFYGSPSVFCAVLKRELGNSHASPQLYVTAPLALKLKLAVTLSSAEAATFIPVKNAV
jgi:hypothetical protein